MIREGVRRPASGAGVGCPAFLPARASHGPAARLHDGRWHGVRDKWRCPPALPPAKETVPGPFAFWRALREKCRAGEAKWAAEGRGKGARPAPGRPAAQLSLRPCHCPEGAQPPGGSPRWGPHLTPGPRGIGPHPQSGSPQEGCTLARPSLPATHARTLLYQVTVRVPCTGTQAINPQDRGLSCSSDRSPALGEGEGARPVAPAVADTHGEEGREPPARRSPRPRCRSRSASGCDHGSDRPGRA